MVCVCTASRGPTEAEPASERAPVCSGDTMMVCGVAVWSWWGTLFRVIPQYSLEGELPAESGHGVSCHTSVPVGQATRPAISVEVGVYSQLSQKLPLTLAANGVP